MIKNPNDPLLCPNSLFNFWFDNWWNMGTSEPSGSIVIAPGETAIREPRVTVYENYYSNQPFEVRYTVCHEWGFKCATASSQIRILGSFAYNFDSAYDGFEFDWWTNPDPDYPFTNIVAQVPEGQSPPWMDLDYESGSPTASSLRLTLPFTTTYQYAYVIRRLPYVDLSHKSGNRAPNGPRISVRTIPVQITHLSVRGGFVAAPYRPKGPYDGIGWLRWCLAGAAQFRPVRGRWAQKAKHS